MIKAERYPIDSAHAFRARGREEDHFPAPSVAIRCSKGRLEGKFAFVVLAGLDEQ